MYFFMIKALISSSEAMKTVIQVCDIMCEVHEYAPKSMLNYIANQQHMCSYMLK